MNRKIIASMAVVAVLLVTAVSIPMPSEASGGTDVLLDGRRETAGPSPMS